MKTIDFSQKFYARRKGQVVACKFEDLHVWFKGSHFTRREGNHRVAVSYKLVFAKGEPQMGYYQGMPGNVYLTIEDCIAERNPINERAFYMWDFFDRLDFTADVIDGRSMLGAAMTYYKAWRWDGFKPVYETISDGGSCKSDCWYNAIEGKFEFPHKKYYSTREECVAGNAIEVIDF